MTPKLPRAVRRLFRLDVHADIAQAVDDELQFHFEMAVRELVAEGHPEDAARRIAEQRFGDLRSARVRLTSIDRERTGTTRRARWSSALAQDVRYALRGMRRSPGFTAIVMLTLALGIGANATMFGIVDRLLIGAPPGVERPDQIARVYFQRRDGGLGGRVSAITSYVTYARLRDSTHAVRDLAAWWLATNSVFGRGDNAEATTAAVVSGNYFTTLGTRAQRGRLLTPSDDALPSGEPVAVLSDAFWRSRFGADSSAVGRAITLDAQTLTVVGVAPPGFGGLNGDPIDLWIPLAVGAPRVAGNNWPRDRSTGWISMFGRLSSGATRDAAAADLTNVLHASATDTSDFEYATRVLAAPAQGARAPDGSPPTADGAVAMWLAGVSLIVLIIACANVANLQLARSLKRRQETAVRVALGIGRTRLFGQFVTESVLLALAGGIAALAIAHWGGAVVRRVLLPGIFWPESLISARVLVFTALATLLVGVLTGLAPIAHVRLGSLLSSLRSGGRDGIGARSTLRTTLLVTQAALSAMLLIGAGAFMQSLQRVRTIDYGFEPTRLLLVDAQFADGTTAPEQVIGYERMRERAAEFSGVSSAALGMTGPFWSRLRGVPTIDGFDSLRVLRDNPPLMNAVSPEFFSTIDVGVVKGRSFTAEDRFGAPRVVIVNETMARRAWPGGDAIGKCVRVGADTMPCSTVVGIVHDTKVAALREDPTMQFYTPLDQRQRAGALRVLLVRIGGDYAGIEEPLRRALLAAAPHARMVSMRTVQSRIDPQARPWQLGATMFGIFGVLALLVTAIGLYSVISYVVTQRMNEFGVRAALGARSSNIAALVLVRGLMPAAAGLALGVAAALALGGFLAPLLFATSPRDAGVIAGVVVTLLAISALACLVPAWRATRVDPITALRAE